MGRIIKKIKDLFYNKKVKAEKPKIDADANSINIKDFNNWFCEIYDGYSQNGKGGEKGIFLRTDKLSMRMVEDYLEYKYINMDESEKYKLLNIIVKNWK